MTTINAVKIDPDGAITKLTIENGCGPLRDLVGGHIETVYTDNRDVTWWCNEEGKLHGLPINEPATLLWWYTTPMVRRKDILCGPVVITGGADKNGDTLSIPEDFADFASSVIAPLLGLGVMR